MNKELLEFLQQVINTHIPLTRENVRALGFTKVLTEVIEKNSHWYVALNPSKELRIAINFKRRDDRSYFTLDTSLYPSRVYRGFGDLVLLTKILANRYAR